MTPQQIDTMKLALEALEVDAYVYNGEKSWKAITAIKEVLAEHAMRETQRLGQEIEQCQCTECQIKPHASDCAVHSEPAYPKGKCDCGAQLEEKPMAKYMGGTYVYLYKDIPVGTLLYTTPPKENT